MILATIALAASLGSTPTASASSSFHSSTIPAERHVVTTHIQARQDIAVDLHPMTEEEKRMYPGRENWDKTEWYEAQFKSAKVVFLPEHVDEWHNGGLELA